MQTRMAFFDEFVLFFAEKVNVFPIGKIYIQLQSCLRYTHEELYPMKYDIFLRYEKLIYDAL